jgi:hypothetical protein
MKTGMDQVTILWKRAFDSSFFFWQLFSCAQRAKFRLNIYSGRFCGLRGSTCPRRGFSHVKKTHLFTKRGTSSGRDNCESSLMNFLPRRNGVSFALGPLCARNQPPSLRRRPQTIPTKFRAAANAVGGALSVTFLCVFEHLLQLQEVDARQSACHSEFLHKRADNGEIRITFTRSFII